MKPRIRTLLLLAILLASAALAATAVGAASKHANVVIKNFAFKPQTLTVSRGTSVTFSNADSTNHTVTANNGTFNLSNLPPRKSGTIRFTKTGTYAYHCTFHPFMKGTIVVK